jgi:hypothetical protein
MAQQITMYCPDGIQQYEIGEGNVSNINVHFYFANVVDVIIYYEDGSTKRFYQVPCMLWTPAP